MGVKRRPVDQGLWLNAGGTVLQARFLGSRAFSFSCLVGKAHHVESFAEMGIVAA